jgi:PAS domain S-box-containing protein
MASRPSDAPEKSFVHRYWRSAAQAADVLRDLTPGEITDDQFRLLADNIPTLCWIANADGYIVWYNRRWHDYCGTTPEEMEGWGWQSVHDADLLPEVMERWTAAVASGEPFEMTFPLRGGDGVFRPFLTRIQPVRDVSGNVARWFGVNTDVSEQLAAEMDVRESEERLRFLDRLGVETASLADADAVLATTTRLLGEHLNLSVCAYADMDEDEDGFTIRGDWAAPEATSIVGHYSLADFGKLAVQNLGAGLPLIINDNRRELPAEEAATFQTIGIAATICMPLVKEGRLTALMAMHDRSPRRWTDAELSLLREVTARSWAHVERVAAVADLRAGEERYRTLFESIESGFCVVEVDLEASGDRIDYRVLEANPAFYRQTGFPETVLNCWLRQSEPFLEEHWYEAYGRVARTGVAERFEQGSERLGRWFDVFAFPVGPPAERRVGILFNDISSRRQAEDQLRELNETLESRVIERTAELEQAHEQLRQSQKLEAMGQLTGGVAHDFNNLLTPIIGSLDMLQRKGTATERDRRLIDGALQSAERAKLLVQRLLAFARRQPLQPQAVDIPRLVHGMADLVASTSGPHVKVVVDITAPQLFAQADPNQLEMAILNLSVNARDAMPDGGTLTIAAKPDEVGAGHRSKLAPARYIRVSVSDTGTGMDAATLARAVEPFFSTKGIGRGTGLGLSMVEGLAAQLGGALSIHSKLGLGTHIDLWLPETEAPANSSEEAATVHRPVPSGTALLVDDEDLVRASTADMLVNLGYHVVEAGSGEEALRLVDSGQSFDVLLTDHLMPGMRGTDLARTLRERFPGCPAIIISGYAEVEGAATDLPRLSKPFRQTELAAALAALVAGV